MQNMSVYGESMFVGTAYKGSGGPAGMEGGSGLAVAVHEIAHQWWGWNDRSPSLPEDDSSAWGSEGLTVYCTHLYLKHRFGEEYARREISAWVRDAQRMQGSFYLTHLQFAERLPGEIAADIYGPYDAVTRYELMPALLLKAEALVGGEKAFVARLKDLHAKYSGQELTYGDFLAAMGLTREEIRLE
jgi:aminopeptidase N